VNQRYFLNEALCTVRMRRISLERFHLPRAQTIFQTALQYMTDPDELEGLFPRARHGARRRRMDWDCTEPPMRAPPRPLDHTAQMGDPDPSPSPWRLISPWAYIGECVVG
jgi:hypothetical protein